MSLLKIWPRKFFKNERIIRHIYTAHCNKSKSSLRANFVAFALNEESGKYELSCNRLEMTALNYCNRLGRINTPKDSNFEGFACTNVLTITEFVDFSLYYSPLINKRVLNYSHSDIYHNKLPGIPKHELGEVLTSEINLQRNEFVKKWNAYFNSATIIQKSFITL